MGRVGIGALLVGCAALFAACGDAAGGAGMGGAAGEAPDGGLGGVDDEPNTPPAGSSGTAGDRASAGAPSTAGSGDAGRPSTPGSGGAGDAADAGNGGESGSGTAPPPAFGYAVLPTSLVRDRCLYDAARLAVYTNNEARYFGPAGVPRVERHRFVTDAWVTDSFEEDPKIRTSG